MLFDAGFLKLVHQGEPPEPTPRAKANLAFFIRNGEYLRLDGKRPYRVK